MYLQSNTTLKLFSALSSNAKILNLNIQNYNLECNSVYQGIIGTANDCTIENVNIDGLKITPLQSNNSAVGGLAGYARNAIFKNITLSNAEIVINGINVLNLGGLIGQTNGNVETQNIYMNNLKIKVKGVNQTNGIAGVIGFNNNADKKLKI